MSDPIEFESTSPRLGLPFLFAGQAQKEAFVNEAHALIDGLLHGAVEEQRDTPPTIPTDGQCWLFVPPRDGMRLLDRGSGQDLRYLGGWIAPAPPALPTGGATIDMEARAAIGLLIDRLRDAGIFPES